ncbi:MAG TPA: MBL fold metallo-hydrolase [Burkholderiaceae bacterium]|nr:MBL fold metallo-hydrolase [Burkholderiaceae bacterium]
MHQHSRLKLALAAASLATATALAGAQTQSDVHRDAATRNVGGDPFMMKYSRAFYCNLPDDNNAIVLAARAWNNTTGANNNQYRIPLTQIFDDVWFVGNHYVGQYMIKTADGIVQVDSGNSATEFTTFNYPALQSLGLAPSFPLKAIFLTHGHGDHDGGAKWALDNLGARSYIGSADNTLGSPGGKTYKPTFIDSTNLAMRQMTIGGKTFWILPTPGHTPGSTSAVLEVKDWGQTKRVLINGGQSMTSSIPDVANYLDSIERTYAMAGVLNVDGVMTPHIYWDGEGEKLDQINATGRTNPSQNIYGHESVMRQLAVARECSAAWLTRLDATIVTPVWRFNTIDFVDGSPSPTRVAAKVSNGWGPLTGQPVTFSVAETGASCSATTGADGVASCDVRPLRPHKDHLTAKFAGAQTTSFVDLSAETSALVCSNGNCNER